MRYARMKIYGRVQGVFFRDAARRRARKLGLGGYVRNCEDGSVEIIVSGPADAVEHFFTWGKKGPPLARVDRAERDEVELAEHLTDFSIR